MIKEIAEEYTRQNNINILNLLNRIKDLDYKAYERCLEYQDKETDLGIFIYHIDGRFNEIEISTINSCLVRISYGLYTKEIKSILEELYNKYYGNVNGVE